MQPSRCKEVEMFCRLAKNVKLAHKETNYKSFLKYLNGINTGYDNVLLVTGKPFNSDLLNNAPLPMFKILHCSGSIHYMWNTKTSKKLYGTRHHSIPLVPNQKESEKFNLTCWGVHLFVMLTANLSLTWVLSPAALGIMDGKGHNSRQ